MRILVVDDEVDQRQALVDVLQAASFETAAAENGRAALEVLTRFRPDAIVLDLAMPDMGGDELFEALGRDPQSRAVPVVIMSGWARSIAPPAPVAAWLPKPFAPEELVALLRRLLLSPAVRTGGPATPAA
jgi:CheY-like chemotaxis protein